MIITLQSEKQFFCKKINIWTLQNEIIALLYMHESIFLSYFLSKKAVTQNRPQG